MSPRRRRLGTDDEPLLFDLPLDDPGSLHERPAPTSQPELFDPESAAEEVTPAADVAATPTAEPIPATVGARLVAGGADLLIHGGVLAAASLVLWAMAVEPRLEYWPALATLLVAFSFLYHVVCLAFWGQTAGMAWQHLFARDRLQRPLSFRQASLRWIGALVTLGLAGLPLVLGFGRGSLSDLLSRSVTLRRARGSAPGLG